MPLAIVTDSTCDLTAQELSELDVRRVPLYVHFQNKTFRDWVEITPPEIMRGIEAGAATPTTSQPTPEDFSEVYREAVAEGADEILVVTLSAELSGTYQSATLAAKDAPAPVTVVDSRNASIGSAMLVRRAAAMRKAGRSLDEIVAAIERLRERLLLTFTVGTLEFLQKGGRIGRASALVGSLLNIKPLLTLDNGLVAAAGRARGAKKAQREMVDRLVAFREANPSGDLVFACIHIEDEEAANRLRAAIAEAGLSFTDLGNYQLGAVIGVHVGPGTYGYYAAIDEAPELGM